MKSRAGLQQALAALFHSPASPSPELVCAESMAEEFPLGGFTILPDRDLAKVVAQRQLLVLVVGKLSATLNRALRNHPPVLLVLGQEGDKDLGEVTLGLHVLGPWANCRVGPGKTILCAPDRSRLQALIEAFGEFRLALCPTPSWLAIALSYPEFAGKPAVGFVPGEVLSPAWAKLEHEHLLVPLGLPILELEPRHPCLQTWLAAQALERNTGPVFPDPAVLAEVLQVQPGAAKLPSDDPAQAALWQQCQRATDLGFPTAATPGLMLRPAISYLAGRVRAQMRRSAELLATPELRLPDLDETAMARSDQVLQSAERVLSDQESKVVLKGFGLEITRQAVASSPSGAAHYAETIGYPVVLKAVSPDLRRKEDLGAVVLDLHTSAAVRRAYQNILHNVEENAPTSRLDGVLVAEMVAPGVDLQVGALRLQSGEAVLFLRPLSPAIRSEAQLLASPLDPGHARLAAAEILRRVSPLRRESDPDPEALALVLLRLDALLRQSKDRILHIDCNPLRWSGSRFVVLDARIVQKAHLEGE